MSFFGVIPAASEHPARDEPRTSAKAAGRHGSVIRMAGILGIVLFLAGCSTPVREEVFDNSGPTTEEVWHGAGTASALLGDAVGRNPGGPGGAAAWTRDAQNELSALFPELRNPRIGLYIFPHLSAAGHPVPGYLTVFYLYPSGPNFALPGEAFREGVLR